MLTASDTATQQQQQQRAAAATTVRTAGRASGLLQRPTRELVTLIALPALLIINVFLIVYILVPVLSGQVASTSGTVNVVNSLYVSDTGRVGIATGGRQKRVARGTFFCLYWLLFLDSFCL